MLKFTATECGSKVDHGTMVCGVSNSKAKGADWHSFIFMRAHRSLEGDSGPYFELDDQSQGFYNGVRSIVLDSRLITIAVNPPRNQLFGHRLIVAELACSDSQIAKFRAGLRHVFRDQLWRISDASGV